MHSRSFYRQSNSKGEDLRIEGWETTEASARTAHQGTSERVANPSTPDPSALYPASTMHAAALRSPTNSLRIENWAECLLTVHQHTPTTLRQCPSMENMDPVLVEMDNAVLQRLRRDFPKDALFLHLLDMRKYRDSKSRQFPWASLQ